MFIPSQPTACNGGISLETTYFSSYTICAAVIIWANKINESPKIKYEQIVVLFYYLNHISIKTKLLLPRIIWFVDLSFDLDDKKSDVPTVAKPTIIVNMPNQWRMDTSRWTNIFENKAVNIITEPKIKLNKY